MKQKIVFLGAGNLATNLSKALFNSGFDILQVYSRTIASAKMLAEQLQATYTNNLKHINKTADIYFIAVKDDAIVDILSAIDRRNKLVVHCSGSTSIEVLADFSNNYGVFYPLQTFSKNRAVVFKSIPIFLEANNAENLNVLQSIAVKLSDVVEEATSEQRLSLHVAAVFACNFVNYLYAVAADILKDNHIDFKHIQPLIEETARKIQLMPPKKAQTGPAVRYDKAIINKHVDFLKDHPDYQQIYELISHAIYRQNC